VKKLGEKLFKQIVLTCPTLGELQEKIAMKFGTKSTEISMIVQLPDIELTYNDDVSILFQQKQSVELEVTLKTKV
jgi:hypothetical protein